MPTPQKRIAVLKAGTAYPKTQQRLGDYAQLFVDLFSRSDEQWEIFDVENGEFPAPSQSFDAVWITGSKYSAYQDLPWIQQLLELLQRLHHKGTPLVGICFGHQALAHALGGETTPNPAGWEIGQVTLEWRPEAEALPLVAPMPKGTRIIQTHQDHVARLPPGAIHLAQSPNTHHEAFYLPANRLNGNTTGPVLGLQGHPELDAAAIEEIMDVRREVLPPELVAKGKASMTQPPHQPELMALLHRFLDNPA